MMIRWIEFEVIEPPEDLNYKPKTQRWAVQTKDTYLQLGIVRWHNSWRKYAFFPYEGTLFEQTCLRDIANFIEDETKKHKDFRK